ncbi:MAG TPA: hypothetical protein DCL44_11080 [Elusimicrobia bacterium]|nr:hypothetical protein [Elusimicrobiota bacterium]
MKKILAHLLRFFPRAIELYKRGFSLRGVFMFMFNRYNFRFARLPYSPVKTPENILLETRNDFAADTHGGMVKIDGNDIFNTGNGLFAPKTNCKILVHTVKLDIW